MFAQFLIWTLIISTVGPVHNEGGLEAVEQHGTKTAIARAWDNRQPVDYSKMND